MIQGEKCGRPGCGIDGHTCGRYLGFCRSTVPISEWNRRHGAGTVDRNDLNRLKAQRQQLGHYISSETESQERQAKRNEAIKEQALAKQGPVLEPHQQATEGQIARINYAMKHAYPSRPFIGIDRTRMHRQAASTIISTLEGELIPPWEEVRSYIMDEGAYFVPSLKKKKEKTKDPAPKTDKPSMVDLPREPQPLSDEDFERLFGG